MFKYTKEIIINSLKNEVDGDKVFADVVNSKLIIKRGGEYKKANILDGKIYKTIGYAGVRSKATIDCAVLIEQNGTNYETGLYQLGIYLKMPNKYLGEYANANWQQFGRPIIVGFDVNASEAAAPVTLAEKLAKLLKLAMQADTKLGTVTVEGSKIVIVLDDPYMHFNTFKLEKYDPTLCDSCLGEYVNKNLAGKVTVEDGVEPFATGDWLQENLRFPTYPNIRYAALNEEEYPIPGEIYVEYSFGYESPRPGLGGLSGVGMKVEALTRHIYYVRKSLVDQFEAELGKVFGNDMIVNYESITIPEADTFAISVNETVKLTPQIYPAVENAVLTEDVMPKDAPVVITSEGSTYSVALTEDANVGDEFEVKFSLKNQTAKTYTPAVVKFTVV